MPLRSWMDSGTTSIIRLILLSTAWPPAVPYVSKPLVVSDLYVRTKLTVLKDHGHGRALVQDPQLALGALLVRRVSEDATVQQRPVSVGNHGTNVPSRVGLLGLLQALAPFLSGLVPVLGVALVGRVDGPALGHLHVRVGKDELAERVVHGEALHVAAAHRDDELSRGAVHGETGSDLLGTGKQELFLGALCAFRELENTEDGADRDTGVEVAAAVNWVADNGVAGVGAFREGYYLILLLRYEHLDAARRAHGRNEEIVANDIELLLVVACGVCGASKTGKVDQRRSPDVVGNRLEGELEGMAQEAAQIFVSWLLNSSRPNATYVKSPDASLCLTCSSFRKRVKVTMSVLIFS